MRKVFVTVGTTKFETLIKTVCDDQLDKLFAKLGYQHITLQIGNGDYQPENVDNQVLSRDVYKLKPSISEDIKDADLVISHAGAGSCLEVLGAGKPLVVVINEELMDNHQLELAEKLQHMGHVYYTTCNKLADTLNTMDLSLLQPFSKGHPEKLAEFIDKVVGLS